MHRCWLSPDLLGSVEAASRGSLTCILVSHKVGCVGFGSTCLRKRFLTSLRVHDDLYAFQIRMSELKMLRTSDSPLVMCCCMPATLHRKAIRIRLFDFVIG